MGLPQKIRLIVPSDGTRCRVIGNGFQAVRDSASLTAQGRRETVDWTVLTFHGYRYADGVATPYDNVKRNSYA
jgi:hypothetical protein